MNNPLNDPINEPIITELNKFLPVVVRVHGESHPELARVAELYKMLKESPAKEQLEELKNITNDFTPPADACPTFCKTYDDLFKFVKDM